MQLSKFLNPISSTSTINPVFTEFKAAATESESMDAICWRSTFFTNLDASNILHVWVEPATVLGLSQPSLGTDPQDALQLVDHIRFRILPPFVVGTGSLNALSAFGVLTNVPMDMVADSTSGTVFRNTDLLGSTATKITTQSSPSWTSVLSFNMRRARDSGFTPLISSPTATTQLWHIGSIAIVHLDTGAVIADLTVPLEVTFSGRSSFMPSSTIKTSLVSDSAWLSLAPGTSATHTSFNDVVSLKHMDE